MTKAQVVTLLNWVVRDMMQRHPLPWRVEVDWGDEVWAGNKLIFKAPHGVGHALVKLAQELDEQNKLADGIIEAL